MTAATLTLTDFLLARIAEVQADVRRRGTTAVGHREDCIYEGGYEGTLSCDCGAVDRVLAECEAKRRIVELCAPAAGYGNISLAVSMEVLYTLAAVYADHPDYRDEWRTSA